MGHSDGPIDLADLCRICHTNSPKYTCPRCAIQTCSLACVKKHKSWSHCSGVRDPAAYRKRHQLATASSVDQDFNFISKLERSLQWADNNAADRGIDLRTTRDLDVLAKGYARARAEIQRSEAFVIKAPKGMSRNKQNKTHFDLRYVLSQYRKVPNLTNLGENA